MPSSGLRRARNATPPANAAAPTPRPITTRIGSVIQPRLKARLRKKTAAATRATPPIQASARPANRSSRSRKESVGAGAVCQTLQKSAFLQAGDETMDARLRFEVERFLHLIERRRDAVLGQVPVDVEEKLVLLFGKHLALKIPWRQARDG